jgi:hypothetical protein
MDGNGAQKSTSECQCEVECVVCEGVSVCVCEVFGCQSRAPESQKDLPPPTAAAIQGHPGETKNDRLKG